MDLYVPSPRPQRTETTVAMSAGRPTPGCAGRGEDPGGRSKVRMEILTSAHGIPSWSLAEDQARPVPAGARRGRSRSRSPHPECPSAPVFTGSLVLTPQGLFQWPSPAVPSRGPPRDAVTPPLLVRHVGPSRMALLALCRDRWSRREGAPRGASARHVPGGRRDPTGKRAGSDCACAPVGAVCSLGRGEALGSEEGPRPREPSSWWRVWSPRQNGEPRAGGTGWLRSQLEGDGDIVIAGGVQCRNEPPAVSARASRGV